MVDSRNTRKRGLSPRKVVKLPAFVLLLLFTLAASIATGLSSLAWLSAGVLAALSVGVLGNFRPNAQTKGVPPNALRRLPKPIQKVFGDENVFAWQQAIFLLYKDNHEYIRHHESQRSTVAALIVTVAAGAIAGALLDGSLTSIDVAPLSVIVVIALFGMLFSRKQFERTQMHIERGDALLDELAVTIGGVNIVDEVIEHADIHHRKKYRGKYQPPVNKLWLVFYSFLAVLGIVLLGWAIFHPSSVVNVT